ncbi:tyrosine-type recombinase/integrase [Kibdelosporangium philippinense]|uniref:tyrosine-type recombinase/integrase n=1 Tax=Kibdelosporangium philippinense TaxID=211113 RepID=UPI0035EA3108
MSPLIGHHAIGAITPETINEFYSELARCREHCTADPTTARAHVGHECRPLSAASIRKIHFLLTAAYRSAIRWHWTTHNPATMANPPRKPRPRPQPPTPTEVTRVLTHAWNQPDPMLGIATWTAIATGARRGELCALRWTNFDADRRVLHIRASVAHDGYGLIIKDTKLHQDREIALDRDTTALLVAYRDHCRQQATAHETTLAPDSFIFSLAPDGSACLAPASLGQRFHRLVVRLGIQTTLHKLRHYNATELILANINLRTVAGRLGHLDCSTTLTTYTAWINEADQRTTTQLIERLPLRLAVAPHRRRPVTPPPPRSLHKLIAEELRTAVINRTYQPGQRLPAIHDLATHYRAAPSTIHRAITQLAQWNLVSTAPGHPTTVHPNPPTSIPQPATSIPTLTPVHTPRHFVGSPIRRRFTRRSLRQPHVAGAVRTGHSTQLRAA